MQAMDRLFDRLILLTTLSCAAYIGIVLVLGGELTRLLAPALIGVGGPLCNFLRARTNQRVGFTVYLWSIWMAVMVQASIRGGLVNPILHGSVVLVLMGGWLLGLRQALLLLTASILWVALLGFAVSQGWWSPIVMASGFAYWLALVSVWSVGYLVLRQVFGAHQINVSEIQALNASLVAKMEALAQQEVATRSSEQKVKQLLTASPLPITVANYASGVYVDVNPAWERFFQYRKDDVIGKTSVDLGFWSDMRQRQGWIDQFSAEGRVSGFEVTFKMRDGSHRIFMLSSERFQYGDDDCILTMSVDVTERKRLESELITLNTTLEQRVSDRTTALDHSHQELLLTMSRLQRAQDELVQSEKLASLGSLVAGVAHELNTPLGNALICASTMANDVDEMLVQLTQSSLKKSTFENFLGRVAEGSKLTQQSLQRAAVLIASFKQVAVDQVSERRRDFDLADAITEVIDTLRPNIKRSELTLELQLAAGITMDSFPGPLGQVVMNLITNAVAHAFDERAQGTIRVSTRQVEGDTVLLVVEDDGAGIAAEHLGHIFDPFFTTKLGRGGSGLGLSISHRICHKILGGHMSVQSTPGQGARFELALPKVAPSVVY